MPDGPEIAKRSADRRRCTCGSLLARDNRSGVCASCRRFRRHGQAPDPPADFWAHKPLATALDAREMGAAIREYRHHPWHGPHALPQGRVARWGGISQGQLSRLENGLSKIHDLGRLITWARALRIPPHLLWFDVPDSESVEPDSPAVAPCVHALPPALLLRRVEPQVAEQARALLREYVVADNLTGPHSLLQTVPAQLEHLERLLPRGSGTVRRDLLHTAARIAEFAGWVYQDAGDLRSAVQFTDRALRHSHEVADRRLVSYALMRQSNIASDEGDAQRTFAFARAALRDWDALTPGLRAVALRQAAAAYTLQRNHAAAGAAMDRALEQVTNTTGPGNEPGNEPDLTAYCTPSYLEMEAATCWIRLGHAEQAVIAFERGLAGWQPEYRRDLGLCLARAAIAYAVAGNQDQAFAAAAQGLLIARGTGSARTIRELRRAQRALTRHGFMTAAADLRHELRNHGLDPP